MSDTRAAVRLDLPVLGMTCASCVRRVERALTRTEGVTSASANYALGRATVTFDPARTSADALAAAITGAGYEVPPPAAPTTDPAAPDRHADEAAAIRREVVVAAVFTVPLVALAMSHGALPWAESPAGR